MDTTYGTPSIVMKAVEVRDPWIGTRETGAADGEEEAEEEIPGKEKPRVTGKIPQVRSDSDLFLDLGSGFRGSNIVNVNHGWKNIW